MPIDDLIARIRKLPPKTWTTLELVVRSLEKSPGETAPEITGQGEGGRDRPTGLAAVIGQWPGDETDEEIAAALRESS